MNHGFLKVLIVDDEPLVRDLLRKCVNWTDLGMQIVGEAASAPQALELIAKLTPDIVFTDICMPSMDGIELAEVIVARYPRTKVVIVTGYEDFEYARRSIKAGVADYILKPINDDEITKVALKIKSLMEEEKTQFAEYCLLKEKFRESLPLLKEKFFQELLVRDFEAGELEKRLRDYNIPDDLTASFRVGVVEPSADQDLTFEGKRAFQIECYELIREQFAGESRVTVFLDDHQRTVLVYRENPEEAGGCREGTQEPPLSRLPGGIYVCIGEGQPHQGLENMRLAYQEACNALQSNACKNNKTSKIIQDIRHYLNEHYRDPELSLGKVAQSFYMNPSYLSRVFRQEVHRTFVEYLTDIRMKKAIQLIKNTDLKAYQVAEAVGITDPHYFGICFKKYTGVSVYDYKRNESSSGE